MQLIRLPLITTLSFGYRALHHPGLTHRQSCKDEGVGSELAFGMSDKRLKLDQLLVMPVRKLGLTDREYSRRCTMNFA